MTELTDRTDNGRLIPFNLGLMYRLHRAELDANGMLVLGERVTSYVEDLAYTDGTRPTTRTYRLVYLPPSDADDLTHFYRLESHSNRELVVLKADGTFKRLTPDEGLALLFPERNLTAAERAAREDDLDPDGAVERRHMRAQLASRWTMQRFKRGHGLVVRDTVPWGAYYANVIKSCPIEVTVELLDWETIHLVGFPVPRPADFGNDEMGAYIRAAIEDGRLGPDDVRYEEKRVTKRKIA